MAHIFAVQLYKDGPKVDLVRFVVEEVKSLFNDCQT
jgi:hypothetical protein